MTVESIGFSQNFKVWLKDGLLHREDGPAIEYPDGTRLWCQYGTIHRVGGPAYETPEGFRSWWSHGRLHRADGPAIERADGYKAWYFHGELCPSGRDQEPPPVLEFVLRQNLAPETVPRRGSAAEQLNAAPITQISSDDAGK